MQRGRTLIDADCNGYRIERESGGRYVIVTMLEIDLAWLGTRAEAEAWTIRNRAK